MIPHLLLYLIIVFFKMSLLIISLRLCTGRNNIHLTLGWEASRCFCGTIKLLLWYPHAILEYQLFCLWSTHMPVLPGRPRVMPEVSGPLSPVWKIQTEFWDPRPNLDFCRHLGSELTNQSPSLSLSLSLFFKYIKINTLKKLKHYSITTKYSEALVSVSISQKKSYT